MAYDREEINSYINTYENKVIDSHEAMMLAIEQGDYQEIKTLAESLKFYANELYQWSIKESEEDIENRVFIFSNNDKL